MTGKFYNNYLLPALRALTDPLQAMQKDKLLCAYFSHFITFAERELFIGKTSDNRPDSLRSFASTWTADPRTKMQTGNLLRDLRICRLEEDEEEKITAVRFAFAAAQEDCMPNFNLGEMVQFYEASSADANVTNRQLFRGTITQIDREGITLELAYHQHNKALFTSDHLFAVEHDTTDSPSIQQFRNLFALLTATPRRRDLLLARREPEADTTIKLKGEHPASVRSIVLQARQAQDYYLLVGPPGTGKTNIALKSMVREFLLSSAYGEIHPATGRENEDTADFRTDALLLTAYTNRAVDEICSMLDMLSAEIPFDYLRIGSPLTCAAPFRPHLLSERARLLPTRREAAQMIDRVPIVVGTVVSLTGNQILFRRKTFRAALVDEASQLLEPQILGLLCARSEQQDAIGKFIFIGDHKQLPAVVQLPERQTRVTDNTLLRIGLSDLRNSLFERLFELEKRSGRRCFTGQLSHQGRMHPDICQFVNRHFYGNALSAVPLPHQEEELHWTGAENVYERFVASTRLGFISVRQQPDAENLCINLPEASAIARIVSAICSLHAKNGDKDFTPEEALGVIVPFRSQIAGIRNALRAEGFAWAERLTIDTVECYQGSQRDYILYSTTISETYQLDIISSVQRIGDAEVDRKLNVALTRARRQLFIFGNPEVLRRRPVYAALIDACRQLSLPEII